MTQQLIAKGKITRGYIGATIELLSDDLADSWGLSGRKGAQVTDVLPGGPAAEGRPRSPATWWSRSTACR